MFAAVAQRWRLVATLFVAVLAVAALVASSGVAIAHGMVTSGEIRNQTISQADVGRGGVSGSTGTGNSEIEGQSVGSWNIGKGEVQSYQLKDSSVHKKDLDENVTNRIAKGQQHTPGPNFAGYEVVGVEQRFEAGTHTLTAECPEGKVAIGGGFQASADGAGGANTDVYAADLSNVTDEDGDGMWQATSYTVAFDNNEATGSPSNQGNMRVRVICAATS